MDDLIKEIESLSAEQRELLEMMLREDKLDAGQLPIPRRSRDLDPIPLSYEQEGLWFLDQLEPNSPRYNMPAMVRLEGRLDLPALEAGFNHLIRRHETLRTTFTTQQGKPVQVIHAEMPLKVEVEDYSHLPEDEKQQAIEEAVAAEASQPFDLKRGPLIRAKLLRRGPEEQVLVVSMHHIIADGWSIGVLISEMGRAYEAEVKGEALGLAELPIQYGDYAVWQREYLQGEELARQLGYWKEQLKGAPEVMNLGTDRARGAVQSYRGGTQKVEIREAVKEGLKRIGQEQGATMYMVMMAGMRVMLRRYSGERDMVIGTAIANRRRKEVEGLIGFFVNSLAMRVEVGEEESYEEVLRREKEVAMGGYENQDVPFEKVVEEVKPERSLSYTPIFQVWFVLQNLPMPVYELADLKIVPMKVDTLTTVFDLTLSVDDTDKHLKAYLEYNTDLFEAATISRMAVHLQTLLEGIVADPHCRISDLPLLTPAEKQQLLVTWNDAESSYNPELSICEMFVARSEQTPNKVALLCGDERLTFGELNSRANQLAHHLLSLGVGPEVSVGLCVERSLDMVVGLLALLKAGGVYVPLDPEYPEERLLFILEDAQVSVLLTQAHLLMQLPAYVAICEIHCMDSDANIIARNNDDNPISKAEPENLAYIIYTSGSTGTPKGVGIPYGMAANHMVAAQKQFGLCADDRVLQFSSLNFDVSLEQVLSTLISGATLIIRGSEVWSAEECLKNISEQELTVINPPTAYWNQLAKECSLRPDLIRNHKLKLTIVGGDAMLPEAARLWRQLSSSPSRLLNAYGPTEAVITATTFDLPQSFCEANSISRIPIGRPLANRSVYILDSQAGPVPVGVSGEFYIGGPLLARGYLNRPDLTAEKFVPDPFSNLPGSRLYKTGDLVRYLPTGDIEFLGRLDNQVKVRGYRIELGEIESALSRHPAVMAALVIVREDTPGDKRLVAYIVSSYESAPSANVLRDFLAQNLPDYMIPSTFVVLDYLPLTPNGKVDRRALPAPGLTMGEEQEDYVAPRDPVEEMLAEIWSDLLGLNQVSVEANFFAIGGDSLLATQLVSHIANTFRVEVPLRSLFENPTIASLSRGIDALLNFAPSTDNLPIKRVPRDAPLPLSFAQERLWFLDQLEPNSPRYNMPAMVRLEGRLDLPALEAGFNHLIRRHETLRTTFTTQQGKPVQVIHAEMPLKVAVEDYSDLPEDEKQQAIEEAVAAYASQPFDLKRGPLIRAKLLRRGPEEQVLVVSMHHIIADGWSIGVLIKEMGRAYEAEVKGEALGLAELPIQYGDYAVWQREYLQGEELARQLGYWKEQLKGAPEVMNLGTDRARGAVQSYRGGTQKVEIREAVKEGLKRIGQEQGATMYMVMMAGMRVMLRRYSGERDMVIGTAIANRRRKEVEGLIGFFVNSLAMRVEVGEEESYEEVLRREKEVAMGGYENQDVPFEKVVEEVKPERSLSYTPIFQMVFGLQNTPVEKLALKDLTIAPLYLEETTAKFDLTVMMEDRGEKLEGTFVYNADLFEAETIRRMVRHYERLLEELTKDIKQRVAQVPILTEAEEHQLLVEWNATGTPFPADKCIHELFEEQALRSPGAIAVIFEGEQVTYGELNRRANKLGHYLQNIGVRPDAAVGVCIQRSVEMIVAILGILKAGGVYVPLDAEYPIERLSFMINDLQMGVILTAQRTEESLPDNELIKICLDVQWDEIGRRSGESPASMATPDNLAYVMYTSGSTGKPKGIGVPHRAVARLVKHTNYVDLDERVTILQLAPISFDASTFEIWGSLLSGGKLAVMSPGIPGLEEIAKAIEINHVNTMWLTAGWFQQMAEERMEGLQGITQLLAGGDVLPTKLVEQVIEQLPGIRLINGYGPTESTTFACCHSVRSKDDFSFSVPIGKPISNTEVYGLDESFNPVPIGVKGELYIGGFGLARGYHNRPDLTAEKFLPNQFTKNGERLYRTGDQVRYLRNGIIEFCGRVDDQVKIRGYRIEPGEVESLISECAGVKECVVVVREEGGEKRLVGYVVMEGKGGVEEIKRQLKQRVPDYMMPGAVVMMEKLPLNANGKVDKRALPAPGGHRPKPTGLASPRTPLEEMLAALWRDILGVQEIGIHESFFDLGGHSLMATRLISKASQQFNMAVTLRSFFEAPTVAALAETIEGLIRNGKFLPTSAIEHVPGEGPFQLSFAQERLWFLEHLKPGNSTFNVPLIVRLKGGLDIAALAEVLGEIVRRHDVLRTTFPAMQGIPIQVISPCESNLSIPMVSLTEGGRQREALLKSVIDAHSQSPFDLSNGPLWRALLIQLAEDDYVMLLIMHHIISDGWSVSVLTREVVSLYAAFSAREPSPLADLPIQYVDFARWQRQWLQADVLETHLAYWRRQLSGNLPILKLPADRPRPPVQTFNGKVIAHLLPEALLADIKALSHHNETTLFMTLLAAFNVLLHSYTAQEDILVGTDIANRNRPETEALIGFFVNQLALRSDLSGDPSFLELLTQARETMLGAFAHDDLPFNLLVDALKLQRDLMYPPVFQAKLVLQNIPVADLKLRELDVSVMEPESWAAKFDLTLLAWEQPDGLNCSFEYNTDLFDAATVNHMAVRFELLLQTIVKEPDARLSELEQQVLEIERSQRSREGRRLKETNLRKLKKIRPKVISDEEALVTTSCLQPDDPVPLVVQPRVDDVDLTEWAKKNSDFVKRNLLKHGAILFRHFNVETPAEFERFALALCPDLSGSNGELPRSNISGKIYAVSYAPPETAILWHSENTFCPSWPMKLLFFCIQPAQQGGETPIVDNRKMFQRIGPKIRERFMEKGIMYLRNYVTGMDFTWQTAFQTEDKSVAERFCQENAISFQWREGDRLRTQSVRKAVMRHPQTGDLVWFNQATLWHKHCLEEQTRKALLSFFRDEDLPRSCRYGDGTPIEDSVMEEICEVYRSTQSVFPWEKSDILLVDNMLCAHARNPFAGPRRIVAAMGEIIGEKDLENS